MRTASRRIALAIDIEWPFKHHHALLGGALEVARERGWTCVLDPFVSELPRGRVDGVLGRIGGEAAELVRRARIPAVNVWANSPDRSLPRVHADSAAGGRLAARHLLARGYRRFAFLGHRHDRSAGLVREGFLAEIRGAGFPCTESFVPQTLKGAAGWRRMRRGLERWIRGWSFPVGVLACDDVSCRALADACRVLGVRVPDDAALTGTGNSETICQLAEPTLTSVEYGFDQVGRQAARLLDRLLRGARPPSRPVLVPPRGIVARASTGAVAVEDPHVSDALRFIAEHCRRPLAVPAILSAVPLSRRTLERRFREHLGRSIHEEIDRARLEHARRLLADGGDPLKGVAAACGFRSAQQFSRVFRAREGCTPLDFRRRHRGG